jgi:hypothetical protein
MKWPDFAKPHLAFRKLKRCVCGFNLLLKGGDFFGKEVQAIAVIESR